MNQEHLHVHVNATPDPRIDVVLDQLRTLTRQGGRIFQALREIDAATNELADEIEQWKGSVSGPDSDRILGLMTKATTRLKAMAADSATAGPA